jgi:glycosyltransferase involved in cell wall biosynthesis
VSAREDETWSGEYLRITWVADLILDMSLHKTSVLQVLSGLSRRGHDTALMCVRSRGHFSQQSGSGPRLFPLPLRYIPLVEPVLYAALLVFLLPLYIVRYKPDFIFFEPELSVVASITSLIISKVSKARFILDVRSTPVESQGLIGFSKRFLFSVSVIIAKTLFSGITIITPMMRKEISEKYRIDMDKMGVWTSGVDVELFDPAEHISKGIELRKEFGLSNKFVVFYHGHLSPGRGLVEAVDAFRILGRSHPGFVLFLMGSGPSAEALRSLVRSAALHGEVIIHGPVGYERVPDFISISDVCLVPLPDHPDWKNQCPLKLLEYFSMEKVVIATRIPAHTEVAGDCPCCMYISSSDPEEIAEAIQLARKNRSEFENWGKSGRIIVRENYTWDRVAGDLESYLHLIS